MKNPEKLLTREEIIQDLKDRLLEKLPAIKGERTEHYQIGFNDALSEVREIIKEEI